MRVLLIDLNVSVFGLWIIILLTGGVSSVHSQQDEASRLQSREAIVLDDQLAEEMEDYRKRYRKFRRSLREKHPRGESRILALEQWAKEHKAWRLRWDQREKRLKRIWNWGPDEKTESPVKSNELLTASNHLRSALRGIRDEEKGMGMGKPGDRMTEWIESHQDLMVKVQEEEIALPPIVMGDRRRSTGSKEEKALVRAREKLNRIRKKLLLQGVDTLKAAMRNSQSQYSQQKEQVGCLIKKNKNHKLNKN